MIYDYVVLGVGVTGLTVLNCLLKKGVKNILGLEAESEPGGLCRTFYVDGHSCDIGGHFFQTRYKEVEDFVFSFFQKDKFYRINNRISKIRIEGVDIDYPLEANVWQLPVEKQVDYLISIIRNGESQGRVAPVNYEEWIRWKLGDKVCDSYLIPYNNKLWGVPSNQLDVDWLHKIPRLEVAEILKNSLLHTQDVNKYPAHVSPYYPTSGGYGRVMEAIAAPVKDYIKTNTSVSKLRFDSKNKLWIVNDQFSARNVVTTIPWPDLYVALGEPEDIASMMEKIKYNKIVISLFETSTNEYPYHWRYRPDLNVQHHREFFISNFAKDSKEYGVFTETNLNRFDSEKLSYNGTNLFNYVTPAAYPIPLVGRTKAICEILEIYKRKNLFGVGRWGEHMHHNQDVCIKNAIEFVEEQSNREDFYQYNS